MILSIIGAGPRGMLALERLISWQKETTKFKNIDIKIFDPYGVGGRVWDVNQPHELIMNTTAQDITLFQDQSVESTGPINNGPSLYEWIKNNAEEYLKINNYSEVFLDEIKRISANDYTSRALFGIYIHWFYEEQLKRIENNIKIEFINEEVKDIQKSRDNFVISYKNEQIISDIVIASLGNLFTVPTKVEKELLEFAKNNKLIYFEPNFANEPDLTNITSDKTVAVRGLGLNFFDLMARFTYGRNGKFKRNTEGYLEYIKSGDEPRIIAGSLHGLPNHSKGKNEKAPGEEYEPKYLTQSVLGRYKKGELSYEYFWKMIKREMNYVYYFNLLLQKYPEIDIDYFQLSILRNPEKSIKELPINIEDHIDWDVFLHPKEANQNDGFEEFIEQFIKEDFQEAKKGTKTGAITSALEVLRDIRATIRYIIDNELFSKSDYVEKFLGQFNSANNLLSMGPPVSRLEELYALIKSGIIEIIPGEMIVKTGQTKFEVSSKAQNANVYKADALIEARIPRGSATSSNNTLINNLNKQKMIKNWSFKKENGDLFTSGAIDFDRNTYQLVNADDEIVNNFYFWGVPTEGKMWLTTASPRPYINDPSLRGINKIISNIWNTK
ncbi:FAD/NAD(P)-binding protein [Companilactobacillus sp. DQM5]|uniref:FAD/NAD(P)-binding protein n=1 Tax=Companilactobacillus sp. DQM5 TaxID=3463359 RepID=UPI004059ED35